MKVVDHSELVCFLVGINWVLSGVTAGLSYLWFDNRRLEADVQKNFKRFLFCLFLFGLSTSIFLNHVISDAS